MEYHIGVVINYHPNYKLDLSMIQWKENKKIKNEKLSELDVNCQMLVLMAVRLPQFCCCNSKVGRDALDLVSNRGLKYPPNRICMRNILIFICPNSKFTIPYCCQINLIYNPSHLYTVFMNRDVLGPLKESTVYRCLIENFHL
uniref:Potassium:hydrogen antiporter n=1 Tax=Rhizophora mucronata TaxID=61149 RepID=A0A2P2M728_RHIMU